MPGAPIKREIRPTMFSMDVIDQGGEKVLIVDHPMDGDRMVYSLRGDLATQLREKLGGGIVVAGADQVPPPPGLV